MSDRFASTPKPAAVVDYKNLTPADIKRERGKRGLSEDQFAAFLGVASDRTIRRWEADSLPVSPTCAKLLELAAKAPAIEDWLMREGLREWQRRIDAGEIEGVKGVVDPQPYYRQRDLAHA